MARFIVSGGILRYPLAGHAQWILGWLVGLQRLGHEVHYVERAGWKDACFDPETWESSDDCSYGARFIRATLTPHGLQDRWSYQDLSGRYLGMSEADLGRAFSQADCYVALWTEWHERAETVPVRVFFDAEPGLNQIRMELGQLDADRAFDRYYTVGLNVGTKRSSAPTAGRSWQTMPSTVLVSDFPHAPPVADAAYVSIMNWQSHRNIEYNGVTYGQKDIEFAKFTSLPRLVSAPFELSVAGPAPRDELEANGWNLIAPYEPTKSIASYKAFLAGSRGYFGVAKNVFVATNSGWLGTDAAYSLASGRPVILQDTGFGDHLPTGEGLFAVRDATEAAMAIAEVERDYSRHSAAARAIATEYLDTSVVLPRFLDELGIE
jgi:hypothetical protein